MSVSLTFLGCGDAFSSGHRLQTCFLLEDQQHKVLIDFGATSLYALKYNKIDPNDISLIFISHFHADHFGGLPFFILDAQFNSSRTQPLIIAGPEGVEKHTRQLMESMYPGSSEKQLNFDLIYKELLPGKKYYLGNCLASVFSVLHSEKTNPLALRIECEGKIISYSGDTEWTDSLIEAAQNSDVFIMECSSWENPIPYHLCYTDILDRQHSLKSKRLILTHLGPEIVARLNELRIEYAEDGKKIIL